MKFKNLFVKNSNEEYNRQAKYYGNLLSDYLSFVYSLTSNEKTQDKISQVWNNLECILLDSKRTPIPRTFYGNESTFIMPYRAVAFVREQNSVIRNGENYDTIKGGLAINAILEKNPGVICHEANHCFSRDLEVKQETDVIYKNGMNLMIYNADEDKYTELTGNLIDESVTDAISQYYTENSNLNNIDGETFKYCSSYVSSGTTMIAKILLGNKLSNKKLIEAYYGSTEDLIAFSEHFDSVMDKEDPSFKDILKIDLNYLQSIDGFNLSNSELILLACKYRTRLIKTQDDFLHELDFIQSLDIPKLIENITKMSDDPINQNQVAEILNSYFDKAKLRLDKEYQTSESK